MTESRESLAESSKQSLIDNLESKLTIENRSDEKYPGAPSGYRRTDDIKSAKNLEFSDIGLKASIVKAVISATDWQKPSPIQEELIPVALEGHNILARAKNGTGKTGSFLLPILNSLDLKDTSSIEAMILAPTRELAMQISHTIIKMQRYLQFETSEKVPQDNSNNNIKNIPKTILLNGGQPAHDQILVLKDHKNQGIKVVVATCGRAYDLAKKKILPLDKIKILALDEADRLLHEQNLPVLNGLLSLIPKDCQKILVSATFSNEVQADIKRILGEYQNINLMDKLSLEGITPYYCCIEEKDKVKAINSIFKRLKSDQSIIFVSTAARATALNKVLEQIGYSCAYIHSKLLQTTRNKIFNSFKNHQYRIIICTDIFKRGIDNANISVVINFDIPLSNQHYLHRVGRAGRYGRHGISIDFVTPEQKNSYAKLMNHLGLWPTQVPEVIDQSLYQNY